jgi:transposase-like protein
MSILNATYFHDEEAAFAKLESCLWPSGPECPHCGVVKDASKIPANPERKVRYGLWRCNACSKQFSVTVGTVFESSHIPVHKWLQAAFLLNSSKKGISAKQIERTLQITYKSAWFMMHRLREAMAEGRLNPFGLGGGAVESDETFLTRVRRRKGEGNRRDLYKTKVLTLVDRTTKQARSTLIPNLRQETIMTVVNANVSREARIMTDQARYYMSAFDGFAGHETVDHSKEEYVRGEAHTNTAEGYFSLFKKGMRGIYQHCQEKHLHRYLAEFDFRYNNREALGVSDSERTERALKGSKGKRLMYRDSLGTAV